MGRNAIRALFLLFIGATGLPCHGEVSLDRARVAIVAASGVHPLEVELARSKTERAHGLMGRPSLDEEAGMLFLYPRQQRPDAGFWMYRTLIPLDIAFLDDQGTIVAIRTMAPCASSNPKGCPAYLPSAPYRSALEVNAGYFARKGIRIGDRLRFMDE